MGEKVVQFVLKVPSFDNSSEEDFPNHPRNTDANMSYMNGNLTDKFQTQKVQTNPRTIAVILFPTCDLTDNCEKDKSLEEEARSVPSVPSLCVHILLCCQTG